MHRTAVHINFDTPWQCACCKEVPRCTRSAKSCAIEAHKALRSTLEWISMPCVPWPCRGREVCDEHLREALEEYLALRRSLGFKMYEAGRVLPRFVAFMEEHQALHITTRLALEWVVQAKTVQPAERARRLGFIRGLARYRSATDPVTEVPSPELLPYASSRARPYLYTEQEVRALLEAALQLPTAWPSTPLRPWVFHCLLGLLSVTGLRISEALDLKLDDVDLEQGVLTIRAAKLGRWRLVPLHPSATSVLLHYLRRRKQFLRGRCSDYVFISNRGTRLDSGRVHHVFYALSRQTG